jgi:hypothetical protein
VVVPLKVTARPLGVNVPARVQSPPTLRSPPSAVESVSAPLMLTPPRTTSGCASGVEPASSIVEPESIVSAPDIWKG